MESKTEKLNIRKNIVYSIGAQIISLVVSFVLNLIVPKFINQTQYAYWQTYMLYVGYVGILHLGLLDGLMLRYSQFNYENLDKPRIRSQFIILFIVNVTFAMTLILIGSLMQDFVTKTIMIMIGIAIVTRNTYTYTSYIFQMTNRIRNYAIFIIIQRIIYVIGILLLLLLNVNNYLWFCIVDVSADIIGVLLVSKNNRGLYFGKTIPNIDLLKEVFSNISAGIILLIANWSSMLLIGSAKMIIQWHWSIILFGKVSFAFSISNLFLTFVSAISIVLFPSLKRMNKEDLPNMYCEIRLVISPLLFLSLLLYFPGSYILKFWLPQYMDSLKYIGILLPTIIFSSKVSLLTNNYLKAYRKEKEMLYINLLSIALAIIFYLFSAYVINNLIIVLIMVVVIIMLRSIFSEIVVGNLINKKFNKEFFIELVLTSVFVISNLCLDFINAMIIYIVFLVFYFCIIKNQLVSMLKKN